MIDALCSCTVGFVCRSVIGCRVVAGVEDAIGCAEGQEEVGVLYVSASIIVESDIDKLRVLHHVDRCEVVTPQFHVGGIGPSVEDKWQTVCDGVALLCGEGDGLRIPVEDLVVDT